MGPKHANMAGIRGRGACRLTGLKMWATTTFVLVLAVLGSEGATDYCKLCSDHTMCRYGSPGPKCNPLIKSGVSSKDREEIVNVHNELRSKVASGEQEGQPSAANMQKMTWDNELAKVAQRWANQCDYNHDDCRKVKRFGVGQNIFEQSSTVKSERPNWRSAVEDWFSEVDEFNSDQIEPFRYTKPTGHYSQVVWAETNKVGCGYAKFPEGGWYQSYYVCNYGPGGNGGESMYKVGEPCTQCVEGTTLCENDLCV